MALCNLCRLSDVGDVHHGICRRLDKDSLRVLLNKGLQILFTAIYVREGNAILHADVAEQANAPAVEVSVRDDMITGLKYLHQRRDGRHAAAKGQCVDPALQRGDYSLHLCPGGILQPAVIKAGTPSHLRMLEGRGLIDWKADGSAYVRCRTLLIPIYTPRRKTKSTHSHFIFPFTHFYFSHRMMVFCALLTARSITVVITPTVTIPASTQR